MSSIPNKGVNQYLRRVGGLPRDLEFWPRTKTLPDRGRIRNGICVWGLHDYKQAQRKEGMRSKNRGAGTCTMWLVRTGVGTDPARRAVLQQQHTLARLDPA